MDLDDDIFKLFSFASSISICSSLHSLLRNGVSPLYMKISELNPSGMEMASRVEESANDVGEESESNKGSMWELEQKLDQPMDEEAGRLRNLYREKKSSAVLLLQLAFQSLGVVYGDLGTSPLYVFYNTFPDEIKDPEDVIGAPSLIVYSLTLIPLLKYVFVVSKANDNGQGNYWWNICFVFLIVRESENNSEPTQD